MGPPGLLAVAAALFFATACVRIAQPEGWAGPTVVDDQLLASIHRGEIASISLDTFNEAWHFPQKDQRHLNGEQLDLEGIYSTPVVAQGTVYLGGYDGWFYALDLATGELRCEIETDGPIIGGAALGDGAVYVGSDDGDLYALNALPPDGSKCQVGVWPGAWDAPFSTGNGIWSTPLLADGILYVTSLDKKAYALDPATGEKRWEFKAGGGLVTTPVLVGDTLFVGGMDRRLHALDAATGQERWDNSFKADNWFWARPLVLNDTVYAASLDGNVYALAVEDGTEKWAEPFDTGSPVRAAPILVNDVLLIANRQGSLYGLNPQTGELLWNAPTELSTTVLADPFPLEDKALVLTHSGDLYRVEAETGRAPRLDIVER